MAVMQYCKCEFCAVMNSSLLCYSLPAASFKSRVLAYGAVSVF